LIIIESAEPREPHHFALLYGASAIKYLNEMKSSVESFITGMTADYAITNYKKLLQKGF
jgi:glutamate synthase (ferredoxin)